MGYCIAGEGFHDAFLSYAHADDVAHNGWVKDFESYLKEQVKAGILRAPDVDRGDEQYFSVCRDETGFPQSGSLDRIIDEKVRQSAFLFVFLGKAYLKSEYCLSELDIFRHATGGAIAEALQRTYVIVLDREAVELLREGNPEQLPKERARLWSTLRDVSQKAIRKENLLRNERLLPVRSNQSQRFDDTFHAQCLPLVEEFTRKLIERRKSLRLQQQRPKPSLAGALRQVTGRILIGAVPPRLARARDELVRELGSASVEVIDLNELRVIDLNELLQEPEKPCQRFAGARLLIQPFDAFQPIINLKRPDPPGGHLGLQKLWFDAYLKSGLSAPGMEMLWWEPVPSNAQEAKETLERRSPAEDAPIERYDAEFLDEIPPTQKRRCTAHVLATQIRAPQSRPSITANVWVEWEETDSEKIKQAQELVHTYFQQVYTEKKRQYHIDSSANIEFGDADWARLVKKLAQGPDGVIIVINENKDDDAVEVQTKFISDLEDVAVKKMFPGIFYMKPQGIFRPPGWSLVRLLPHKDDRPYNLAELLSFKDLQYHPAELTGFVERLFDVIYSKYMERPGE